MRFSTNGIREIVGERLTPSSAVAVGEAIARVAPSSGPIALGRDGRTSSQALSDLMGSTLVLGGHDVVDLGLLPTPAIQYNLPRIPAAFGVAITASHNPPEYNGFKCLDQRGRSISAATERSIEEAMAQRAPSAVPFDRVGELWQDHSGASRYVDGILAQVDVERIRTKRYTVVLDCGNGATAVTSPPLLSRLGCRVISLNGHVDGRFPGRTSEPNERTLQELLRAVPAFGADLGIAHDGDGDRTLFVDARGRFVPGDKSLALLAGEAARTRGGRPIVTPVSTSQVVEDVVRPFGAPVVYTPVGSPKLTGEMERVDAVLGGEENGGVVFPRFQLARDGAMTAAALLDLLAGSERSFEAMIDELPPYSLIKERVPCPPERAASVVEAVAAQFREGAHRVVTLDGFKIYTDGGWMLLRPSGTEPIVRIFAETRDPATARRMADDAVHRVRERLGA